MHKSHPLSLGLALLVATAAACGDDSTTGGDIAKVIGAYSVMIEANGKTDPDTLNITAGSHGSILLNYVHSFSQMRSTYGLAGNVTVLSQPMQVQHATGTLSGTGGGKGTITADGMIDLTVDLAASGASADAGTTVDGGAVRVSYHITGMKQ
jgi:hypothetical protein